MDSSSLSGTSPLSLPTTESTSRAGRLTTVSMWKLGGRHAGSPRFYLVFRRAVVVEWYAGERPASAAHKAGRPHVAFRYNLLEHFGAASSLRDGPPAPVYAFCYDELDGGVVFDVEAFQRAACGHAFVHPCVRSASLPPPSGSEPLPGIPFDELSARAREDSVQTWAPHPPPKPPRG